MESLPQDVIPVISNKKNDTLNSNLSNLIYYLVQNSSPQANYEIIEQLARTGNWENASDTLTNICNKFVLNERELVDYNHYSTWFEFCKNIADANRTVMQLDSAEIGYLFELANEYNDWVGVRIKNLLCFGYNICFEDQISSNDSRPEPKELTQKTKSIDKVKVYPNPGNLYIIFDISLSELEVPATILISDLGGKTLVQVPVTEPSCQKLLDVRNLPNSMYEYRIQSNGKTTQTGKLTINH